MSVRFGLLALLDEGAQYGAQLKASFERRTGGAWPVNVGQVYTTLDRLVRDGLVRADDPDAEGRIRYRLTPAGGEVIAVWWRTPVEREATPRDELVIKLALALTSAGVDSAAVVQAQRSASMRRLQQLTRLKQSIDPGEDLAWLMVVEHQLFAVEAEIRWLDQVEASVRRFGGPAPDAPTAAADRGVEWLSEVEQ